MRYIFAWPRTAGRVPNDGGRLQPHRELDRAAGRPPPRHTGGAVLHRPRLQVSTVYTLTPTLTFEQ
jgi:hypothetical protein